MKKVQRTVFSGDLAAVVTKEDGVVHEGNSRIIVENVVEDDSKTNKIFRQGEAFVKLFDTVVPSLVKKLTPAEVIFILQLVPYVSYTDCIIRRSNHGNSEMVDAKEIAKMLHMPDSTVRRLIASLKKKGVIGYHETGDILPEYEGKMHKVYTVNPNIFFRGIKVNDSVDAFYEKTGWAKL